MICRDFQIYHHLICIKYQLHLVEMTYPSWPLRSHIGRKISQTPNFSRQHMGCARLSQKLKSPTKLTECALGAHTAKRVPHSPPSLACHFWWFFRGIRMDQVLVASPSWLVSMKLHVVGAKPWDQTLRKMKKSRQLWYAAWGKLEVSSNWHQCITHA